MEKLKFRYWDPEAAQMVQPFLEIGSQGMKFTAPPKDKPKQLVILQYTGMDALNGEIYDGDIIRFPIYNEFGSVQECTAPVFWSTEIGGWSVRDKSPLQWARGRTDKSMIIGNIYQHKHLLKP